MLKNGCPKSNKKNLRTNTQCYLLELNQNEHVEWFNTDRMRPK